MHVKILCNIYELCNIYRKDSLLSLLLASFMLKFWVHVFQAYLEQIIFFCLSFLNYKMSGNNIPPPKFGRPIERRIKCKPCREGPRYNRLFLVQQNVWIVILVSKAKWINALKKGVFMSCQKSIDLWVCWLVSVVSLWAVCSWHTTALFMSWWWGPDLVCSGGNTRSPITMPHNRILMAVRLVSWLSGLRHLLL